MPRLTSALPKYRKHRSSGQAIATLSGVDFYLGPHGTKASRLEYDRVLAEWLENGRQLRADKNEIMIVELVARYWRFAKEHYVKNGEPTGEQPGIKAAVGPLKRLYGHTKVTDFGSLALKVVRQQFVDAGNSRPRRHGSPHHGACGRFSRAWEPTTTFALRPARCLAGMGRDEGRLALYLLNTRREFVVVRFRRQNHGDRNLAYRLRGSGVLTDTTIHVVFEV